MTDPRMDARMETRIDGLLRRLDVPSTPDTGFVSASVAELLPQVQRARRADRSSLGRLRRDVSLVLRPRNRRPPSRRATFAGILVLMVLILAALLVIVVGSRKHLPPPFGPAANGTIAYVANGQIFLANADGTQGRQVTSGDRVFSDPTFSRDGTQLAWRGFPPRSFGPGDVPADALVADADGTHVIVIARQVLGLSHIAWSPDGLDVAFSGSIGGGPDSGWIARADGSEPPHAFTTIAGAWDPTWSPDGTRLAIGASSGLIVMNRDGSDARPVTHNTYTEIGERGEIAEWSPDGSQLLFTAFTGDGEADFDQEVYVVGLDGRPERLLSPDALRARDAVWSPDGTQIAYMRNGIGFGPIAWITDLTGLRFKSLPGYYGWFQPIWSPDGTKVVVTDDRPGPANEPGPAVRVILDVARRMPPVIIPAPGVTPEDVPDWAASWQRLAP